MTPTDENIVRLAKATHADHTTAINRSAVPQRGHKWRTVERLWNRATDIERADYLGEARRVLLTLADAPCMSVSDQEKKT